MSRRTDACSPGFSRSWSAARLGRARCWRRTIRQRFSPRSAGRRLRRDGSSDRRHRARPATTASSPRSKRSATATSTSRKADRRSSSAHKAGGKLALADPLTGESARRGRQPRPRKDQGQQPLRRAIRAAIGSLDLDEPECQRAARAAETDLSRRRRRIARRWSRRRSRRRRIPASAPPWSAPAPRRSSPPIGRTTRRSRRSSISPHRAAATRWRSSRPSSPPTSS